MDKIKTLSILKQDRYYTADDLRYNQKLDFLLSKDEFNAFLDIKDSLIEEGNGAFCRIPLKTFNSKHCFYTNTKYLPQITLEYLRIFLSDLTLNQSSLFGRNTEDMIISRLFSEVEGSLNIENVPTTHKRISQIHQTDAPTEQNDIIIKNMLNAVRFIVMEKPAFNKENLRKLYGILSENCLEEALRLKDGSFYRDDSVYIGDFEGAPPAMIDECMDSLFAFANDPESIKKHDELLPYICHYYILYVHPYFDYNGRTARMVSFWLNCLYSIPQAPFFMSEAINESKSDYYRAIVNTRLTRNDLTYFLGYILETSIQYSFVYKNLEEMRKKLLKTGDTLTSTEWVYVKKILVHNPEDFFNYKLFLEYIGASMTKAGAYKILNNLTSYDILRRTENKKGEIIYKFNSEMITYKYS